MANNYYSHGKLLLTGEYAVLDGALSLAVPTTYGQSLSVKETNSQKLIWRSRDEKSNIWFEHSFDITAFSANLKDASLKGFDPIAQTLYKLLVEAQKQNPEFLNLSQGLEVETKLDFPQDWGLGSSSTLINNIAQWARVDAFKLLWSTLGGSGYDIACAQHNTPILYRLTKGQPYLEEICYDPPFKTNIFFIHLNKKQNSREGISNYREQRFDKEKLVAEVTAITKKILLCDYLSEFEALIQAHENLISSSLGLQTIQERYFSDYPGQIKSLGAWGGDFILATGNSNTPDYFIDKGFKIVIPFENMKLAPKARNSQNR